MCAFRDAWFYNTGTGLFTLGSRRTVSTPLLPTVHVIGHSWTEGLRRFRWDRFTTS